MKKKKKQKKQKNKKKKKKKVVHQQDMYGIIMKNLVKCSLLKEKIMTEQWGVLHIQEVILFGGLIVWTMERKERAFNEKYFNQL